MTHFLRLILLGLVLFVPSMGSANALPEVDVPAVAKVKAGDILNLPLTVVDPDGDIPAALLISRPEGMELIRWSAEQLLLTWSPSTLDIGEHAVVILFEDARDRAVTVKRELRVFVRD